MASSRSSDAPHEVSRGRRFSQRLPLDFNFLRDPYRQRESYYQQRHSSSNRLSTANKRQLDNRQRLHSNPSLNTVHIPSASLFTTASNDDTNNIGNSFTRQSKFLDYDEYSKTHDQCFSSHADVDLISRSSPNATTATSSSIPFKPSRSILKPSNAEPAPSHTLPHDTHANTTRNLLLTSSPSISPTHGSPVTATDTTAGAGGRTSGGSLRSALASARRRFHSLSSTSASYFPALGLADADKKVFRGGADAPPRSSKRRDPTSSCTEGAESSGLNHPANKNKKTVRFDRDVAVHPIDISRRTRRRKVKKQLEDEEGDEEEGNKEPNKYPWDADALLMEAHELRALFL